MRFSILSFLLFFAFYFSTLAQEKAPENFKPFKGWEYSKSAEKETGVAVNANSLNYSRPFSQSKNHKAFEEGLAPFYHGVASGDPMTDRVIIWTRVSPDELEGDEEIEVNWLIALDPEMTDAVSSGTSLTDNSKDYTVKVDVTGLDAGTTYYYQFEAFGTNSLVGRTKTAPELEVDRLRFAVASCSNYQAGYFNAYSRISEHLDLDAVIHLGDYIYEYGGGSAIDDRIHEPSSEILSLADYRTRHSLYKLDADCRNVHQQYAFIPVWDDHESANNSYQNGADNHNAGEGDWEERKNVAKQAYFEWMPIREQEGDETKRIYRKLSYGPLADIFMLDTRLEGRDMQLDNIDNPELQNPDRTILGASQYQWLTDQLSASTARWKVIGNQVVFSPLNTLNLLNTLDAWDGYPVERDNLIDFVKTQEINNMVFITGDVHVGFAGDVTKEPDTEYDALSGEGYDPETGDGAFGVEMVSASVTSSNLDETDGIPIDPDLLPGLALGLNPHGKFANLVDHGYFILDLQADKAQGDWYWIDTKTEPSAGQNQQESWFTNNEDNFLQQADSALEPMANPPAPAPIYEVVGIENTSSTDSNTLLISFGPNPSSDVVYLHYALNKKQEVKILLFDLKGSLINEFESGIKNTGVYSSELNCSNLPEGNYIIQIKTSEKSISRKFQKVN